MTFTQQLWDEIQPVYRAVLEHPFIRQLTDGSLSRDRFAFYMKQDALYLQDFSRALAIAGARLPVMSHAQSFFEFASGVAVVERALHETYFREFDVEPDVERSPSCFAYAEFLLARAATGSQPEAVAALLPCFWIYREVGNEIYAKAKDSLGTNTYARWIETYSGEHFNEAVERAISICDAVADEASAAERGQMSLAFDRSARLEWMFWDSAYRMETWPPPAKA
jgi:thiaminase (transcriptional activator TenA)